MPIAAVRNHYAGWNEAEADRIIEAAQVLTQEYPTGLPYAVRKQLNETDGEVYSLYRKLLK